MSDIPVTANPGETPTGTVDAKLVDLTAAEAAGAEVVGDADVAGAAGALAVAAPLSAAAAFFLRLFLVPVSAAVADVSPPAGVVASAAAFLLFFDCVAPSAGVALSAAAALSGFALFFFDFFVDFVADSSAAALLSVSALSFFAFFLDFLVVSVLDVSVLDDACAFAIAGKAATASVNASIHNMTLYLDRFIGSSSHEGSVAQFVLLGITCSHNKRDLGSGQP